MTKLDLKSGYRHVDIFREHYLGDIWDLVGLLKTAYKDIVSTLTYYYLFGLSTAPYIFTKLLRPLEKLWRSSGFSFLSTFGRYID
jgi:hypothetical protein